MHQFVADYVLTTENLITGSLADDDVPMGGYHIGIYQPGGSGWRWTAAARPSCWQTSAQQRLSQVRRRARRPVGRVLCTCRSGPAAIHLLVPDQLRFPRR